VSAHDEALRFAGHWRDRGYVMQDAADGMDATEEAPDVWLVAGHVVSASVEGVAIVCPNDCSGRWRGRDRGRRP
jgi:hypothetical protein